jgi:hypothetical protein
MGTIFNQPLLTSRTEKKKKKKAYKETQFVLAVKAIDSHKSETTNTRHHINTVSNFILFHFTQQQLNCLLLFSLSVTYFLYK